MNKDDIYFMNIALEQATIAFSNNEVPIGAVAVKDNEVIAKSYNRMVELNSVLGHAEIELLRACEKVIGDWRMEDITFYVTKEPCAMCAGALVNARVKRVVYGLRDFRSGCAGSSELNVCNFSGMLWQVETCASVLEEESKELIQNFFKTLRKNK